MTLAALMTIAVFCVTVLFVAIFLPGTVGGGRFAWRLLEFLESFSAGLDALFRRSSAAWFEPVTADESEVDGVRCIFATAGGDLVTIIRVRGVTQVQDVDEVKDRIAAFEAALSSYYASAGHSVQIRFSYDPAGGLPAAQRFMEPLRKTAERLRLDIDFLLTDWAGSIGKYAAEQETYLAVWTTQAALSSAASRKEAAKIREQKMRDTPLTAHSANPDAAMPALIAPHAAFIRSVQLAFANAGIKIDMLDVHAAARVMRSCVTPESTSAEWKPVLAGDVVHPRVNLRPDGSGALIPTLKEQIFPVPMVRDGEYLIVGARRYAFVYLDLWPQAPQPFGTLLAALQRSSTPHIMSVVTAGNALQGTGLKSALATVFSGGSDNNKILAQSLRDLGGMILAGETMIGVQAVFATWTSVDEPKSLLRERQAAVSGALASWGACEPSSVIGDPALAFTALIPGASRRSPANRTPAPFREIIPMLPIERVAPLWDDGGVLYRSGSRLFPYRQGSKLQTAPVTVGFAPMGGGKSVNIGVSNLGFILQSEELPYLSISDIGPSSKALITLVRMGLPAHMRHMAQYHRLRYEPKYASNVCDMPLGGVMPLPAHEKFLVNFLCLLCGNSKGEIDEAIPGLATRCVKAAYEDRMPNQKPRNYQRGVDSDVDAVLAGLGVEVIRNMSWYDVRDVLFDAGRIHEATLAQRYAVPTLSAIASKALDSMIANAYSKTIAGEEVPRFFFRKVTEAIQRIPILDEPSRFSLDDARIIALDLDEICPNASGEASAWLAAVAVMLSRHLLASRFFQMPEDADLFPEKYRDYQRGRIRKLREMPKKLVFDEVQRFSTNKAVVDQFVADAGTMVREGRKWNLYLEFYSQLIEHLPDDIVKLALTRYVFGGSKAELLEAAKKLHLPPAAVGAALRIGNPGRAGANFLACYRVDGVKNGESVVFLTSTLGPPLLWGLETNPKNASVRDRLYERWGVRKTLEILGKHFPGGVVDEVTAIERELDSGDTEAGAIDAMVSRIVSRFDGASG